MATGSASANIPKKAVTDFKFIKEINVGSYSTVSLAIEKATNRELAIKAISKDLIKRMKKVHEIFREKNILALLTDCPYVVKLYCTLQDETTLYFGLTYCANGDLLQYITATGGLSIDVVRFYSAELVEALEYLQNRRIIHRDLKPENILLTDEMHIQLADFGCAITVENNEATDDSKDSLPRRNSFVGTAQFVPPEVLQNGPIHFGSDLWSFGCIIYQMVTGEHLFSGSHEYEIMCAIVRASYKIPDDFPETIGDLVRKLVCLESSQRLGSEESGGINRLKEHPFFSEHSDEIKWADLLNRPSPLEANVKFNSRPELEMNDTND